jgi:hypothetical protein
VAFDDDDFEITSALSRSAAIPMGKVNGENAFKKRQMAVRVDCHSGNPSYLVYTK